MLHSVIGPHGENAVPFRAEREESRKPFIEWLGLLIWRQLSNSISTCQSSELLRIAKVRGADCHVRCSSTAMADMFC